MLDNTGIRTINILSIAVNSVFVFVKYESMNLPAALAYAAIIAAVRDIMEVHDFASSDFGPLAPVNGN